MFGLLGKIRKLQQMLKESHDHIRVLQEELEESHKTIAQSVDNFNRLGLAYAEQHEIIERLMRNKR